MKMKRVTTFAERLSTAMRARDLTQSDLARLTGIEPSSISNYLAGKYAAKQDKVFLLAKALNVSEAWLMGLDTPMERIDASPSFRSDEEELEEYLELLRTRPECRMLLKTAKGATRHDVEENVRFIEALRKARNAD